MTAHPLNPLLLDTGTPPIPEAKAWLKAYSGRHGPPVDLSQAAPGESPPPELLERAAAAAGSAEAACYGSIFGDASLREALAGDMRAFYGGDVSQEDVAVTTGCNQAFVIAMMALARAGDAVLLPAPWYFNHEMTLRMLGVEARLLPTRAEAGFVPDVEAARALIDNRLRAIVLVTPNNPTGAVYPAATIAAFADLCRENGLALVLDETYRDFLPDGAAAPHDLFTAPDWRETLIHLYSFSKSYAVPGWRLGALVAGSARQAEIGKALDCVQICPPRAGQQAIAWGVGALREWRAANRAAINARAAAFKTSMSGLNGWRVDQIGAYFAYVRHPFESAPADEVARLLAESWGVLALPGSFFGPGQERHLRVAFANADAAGIVEAASRLARVSPG